MLLRSHRLFDRRTDVSDRDGRFVWYELLTTDIGAAKSFYCAVLGWSVKDASTPDLAYSLFTDRETPVSGLMELPEEATKMGAMPRWVGYIGVNDVDAIANRLKSYGGAVYVPPTNSNIGRVSIVADPQGATFALVSDLRVDPVQPDRMAERGYVGWHELLASDSTKAFAFYAELFGWQKGEAQIGPMKTSYQFFSVREQTLGGMLTKLPTVPLPFWLYYFNVGDLDEAAERAIAGGGQISQGPTELPDGNWIARCTDPEGAMFALQGRRSEECIRRAGASQISSAELAWSTAWHGISSKGRLVGAEPNPKPNAKPKPKPRVKR